MKRMPTHGSCNLLRRCAGSFIAIHSHVHPCQLCRTTGKALQGMQASHMGTLSLQGSKGFKPHGATAMQKDLTF